jgi:putative Mg2+ transporter-C (MgtC) family protein
MEAIWHDVWQSVRADFSDLPGVGAVTQLVLRMLLAALLGGVLGYQRERQGKEAGLRTHMLVALGSAFFVLVPLQAGMSIGDLSRVLQGLIAGIGFLLAGTILKQQAQGQIHGLPTTAGLLADGGGRRRRGPGPGSLGRPGNGPSLHHPRAPATAQAIRRYG